MALCQGYGAKSAVYLLTSQLYTSQAPQRDSLCPIPDNISRSERVLVQRQMVFRGVLAEAQRRALNGELSFAKCLRF